MIAHYDEYCRGIAQALKGASVQAGVYVNHSSSLGTLREKMVGKFIREATPEKLKVETGLVRAHGLNITSNQCDVLVHDCWTDAPLYRFEDFVVVHSRNAKAVVEVKSQMDGSGLADLFRIQEGIGHLKARAGCKCSVLGYGLKGATLSTIAACLAKVAKRNMVAKRATHQTYEALRKSGAEPLAWGKARELHARVTGDWNWPSCIVIQDRNIIGVKPIHRHSPRQHDVEDLAFCLADLKEKVDENTPDPDGIETGGFLWFYRCLIELPHEGERMADDLIYRWFNKLPLKLEGKRWISSDGRIHTGNIPEIRKDVAGDEPV